jgi:hypothetical protein
MTLGFRRFHLPADLDPDLPGLVLDLSRLRLVDLAVDITRATQDGLIHVRR